MFLWCEYVRSFHLVLYDSFPPISSIFHVLCLVLFYCSSLVLPVSSLSCVWEYCEELQGGPLVSSLALMCTFQYTGTRYVTREKSLQP